ncbi:MAG: GntP family permease [Methanolinea sp.]|nr:GntP family permease [Methanolinea sp.]
MPDALLLFLITLVLITCVSLLLRAPPFFTLIGAAVFYGLLSGMNLDSVFQAIIGGLGRVFGIFAIIILCGAVIARTLQEQGLIEALVADIRRRTGDPHTLSGLAGYLFALPTTCCITAFVMLSPVLERLGRNASENRGLLYLAAVGSVISYTLVYPTPVTIPLFSTIGSDVSPLVFDLLAIPLSLILLAGIILAARARTCRIKGGAGDTVEDAQTEMSGSHPGSPDRFHWRAWAPFLVIVVAIPAGILLLSLPHASLIQFIMLAGAAAAIALAPHSARMAGIQQGTKHAGMIMFDICGAGALGSVIVKAGFASQALPQIAALLPLVLVPFVLTALIQAAQGSRVVTTVIASELIAGGQMVAGLHPITLLLSISAGACVVSYVTDPYFWLLQRSTGDGIGTVVKHYTVPLAVAGIVVLLAAIGLDTLVLA